MLCSQTTKLGNFMLFSEYSTHPGDVRGTMKQTSAIRHRFFKNLFNLGQTGKCDTGVEGFEKLTC